MNTKIAIKYLNITNYPYVERYLEDMASRGWLLKKIIGGFIFIFRRIAPEELEFSISPYEVETAFTRKSKEELREFESVCEFVGWNYCTRSYDLHIYYKEKNTDVIALHTDIEEEFELLERIGKKQIRGYYILLPMIMFLNWFNLGMVGSLNFMRNGLFQLIAPILPIGLILIVYDWILMGRFIKKNRDNIKLQGKIEYRDSKFYFIRFSFITVFSILFLIIIYAFYMAIALGNKMILWAYIPTIIGLTIGQLYRVFVKPSKYSRNYKIGIFIVGLLVAIGISNVLVFMGVGNTNYDADNIDRQSYKFLSNDDFPNRDLEDHGNLIEDVSLLVPKSYEYESWGTSEGDYGDEDYVKTEYWKALTEGVAKTIVNRYKSEGEQITEVDNSLWNVDEVYFMRRDRHRIVLRRGREVFFLAGKDFGDADIIEISMEQLGLGHN